MSLSSETSSVSYAGNASTVTAYPVTFAFFADSDLCVTRIAANGEETALTLNVDYTVTGGDAEAGATGSIVTTEAIPSTEEIRIDRDVPLTQPTSFTDLGTFPSSSVDRSLDRLTMQVQQVERKFDLIDGGGA